MFVVARKTFACFIKNDAFEGLSLSKQGDGVIQADIFTTGGNQIFVYMNVAEAESLLVYLKAHGLIGKEDLDKLLVVVRSAEDY